MLKGEVLCEIVSDDVYQVAFGTSTGQRGVQGLFGTCSSGWGPRTQRAALVEQ